MSKKIISSFVALLFALTLLPGSAYAWENPNFSIAQFGGTSNDIPNSIESDSLGNTYVSGYFAGTTDFNPSAIVDSATSLGAADAFIAKYSATGSFLWAKHFGGIEDDQVIATAIDASNNLYLTGTFKNTVDFDYTSGVETATANGAGTDIFVTKINSDGTRLWTKTFGSFNATDTAFDLAVDGSGNVIVVGNFYVTVDFDPGAGSTTFTAGGGFNDIFVLKLNTNGEFVWAKALTNGQSNDEAQGVAVFPNGDVVIVGGFGANTIAADFDPGPGTFTMSAGSANHNIFIWKLTSDGTFAWAKNIGNSATADRAYSVGIDSSSNVYTTGTFQSTAAFSPSGDTLTATSYDGFLIKHDSSGTFQWVKQFAGSGGDYGRRIAMDQSSNIFVTGTFNSTLDIDPGPGTTSITSAGLVDTFIAKLTSSGALIWGKSLGSTGNDYVIASTVNRDNHVLNAGYMSASLTLTENSNTLSFTLIGATDAVFLCINSAGSYRCGIEDPTSNISSEEQERRNREERERAVTEARNEVTSLLDSGSPLSKEKLAAADFRGVTEKNIEMINAEIQTLAKGGRVEITDVTKIVKKYEVLGRVESNGTFFFSELVQAGIIDGTSLHRSMIMIQLRKLPRESVDSEAELKAAIASIEKVYVARKVRLQEIIARIQSRSR